MLSWQEVEVAWKKFMDNHILPDLTNYEWTTETAVRTAFYVVSENIEGYFTALIQNGSALLGSMDLSKFGVAGDGIDVTRFEKAVEFIMPKKIDIMGYLKKKHPVATKLLEGLGERRMEYEIEKSDAKILVDLLKAQRPARPAE